MTPSPLDDLTLALRDFARERDWEQFHTPKNLAMSLMIEAAEVGEHFQWTPGGSRDAAVNAMSAEKKDAVALEIADTLLYLLRLADVLGIDVVAAAKVKMEINRTRYPVKKAFGSSLKYNEL